MIKEYGRHEIVSKVQPCMCFEFIRVVHRGIIFVGKVYRIFTQRITEPAEMDTTAYAKNWFTSYLVTLYQLQESGSVNIAQSV
jgi:hypothetical protein